MIWYETHSFGDRSAMGSRDIRPMRDFRGIRAWRKAKALAISFRRQTETFPRGYGGFKSQLLNSVESIGFNICEGCGAATNKEYARFLDISIKSTTEFEGQLEYAYEYGLLSESQYRAYLTETIDIRKMLDSLRRKVLEEDDDGRSNRQQ